MRFDSAPAAPYMKKGCEVMGCKYKVGDILIGNKDNHYGYTAEGVYVIVVETLSRRYGDDIAVKICSADGLEIDSGGYGTFRVESRYFDYVGLPAEISLFDILVG